MLDYSDNKEERKNYVLKYNSSKTGLIVKFAGKRDFAGIADTEETKAKLDAKMHEQGKRAVAKLPKIVKNCKLYSLSLLIGADLLSGGAMLLTATDFNKASSSGLVLFGAAATISSGYYLVKNIKAQRELKKLSYLYSNEITLNNYQQYPNSFANVNKTTINEVKTKGIKENNIDTYNLKDLKKISTNINTEKAFNFTYQKVKK